MDTTLPGQSGTLEKCASEKSQALSGGWVSLESHLLTAGHGSKRRGGVVLHEWIWGRFILAQPINNQLIWLGLVLVAEQIPKEIEPRER